MTKITAAFRRKKVSNFLFTLSKQKTDRELNIIVALNRYLLLKINCTFSDGDKNPLWYTNYIV